MNSATGTKKTVGFGKALVVFICVFVLILCGINVLGTSAHIPLVIATIVATIAGVSSGFTWDEMEKGMSETIKASAPAILIMLIIGMVVGTWMLGGIIPTMIYYGLTWLSRKSSSSPPVPCALWFRPSRVLPGRRWAPSVWRWSASAPRFRFPSA